MDEYDKMLRELESECADDIKEFADKSLSSNPRTPAVSPTLSSPLRKAQEQLQQYQETLKDLQSEYAQETDGLSPPPRRSTTPKSSPRKSPPSPSTSAKKDTSAQMEEYDAMLKELEAEYQQELAAISPQTGSTSPRTPVSPRSASPKSAKSGSTGSPEDWRKELAKLGFTEEDLNKSIDVNDLSPDPYDSSKTPEGFVYESPEEFRQFQKGKS